ESTGDVRSRAGHAGHCPTGHSHLRHGTRVCAILKGRQHAIASQSNERMWMTESGHVPERREYPWLERIVQIEQPRAFGIKVVREEMPARSKLVFRVMRHPDGARQHARQHATICSRLRVGVDRRHETLPAWGPGQTNRYDDWAAAICGATSARMASTRMMFMAARVLRALAVVKVTRSRRPEGDRSGRRRARLTDRRTGTSPPSAGTQPPRTPAGSAPPAPVHRTAYQPPRALQYPVGAHEGGE